MVKYIVWVVFLSPPPPLQVLLALRFDRSKHGWKVYIHQVGRDRLPARPNRLIRARDQSCDGRDGPHLCQVKERQSYFLERLFRTSLLPGYSPQQWRHS